MFVQEKSNLPDLVQVLIVTFGEQCPVYSTASTQPRPQKNQPHSGYPQSPSTYLQQLQLQQQHGEYP